MFTGMKKITLQSISLILNIIYVPFYIANRICTEIISYLGVKYEVESRYDHHIMVKNTGFLGFIDQCMDLFYDFWTDVRYEDSDLLFEQKTILINLFRRLISLPFIAALAITKGVLMLAVSALHATNYLLENVVMSAINKLITTIDSHIASYDKDDSSHRSHKDDKSNTWASKDLGLGSFDWPFSLISSQDNNSNLKTNNNSALNESPYADTRSHADSDESIKSRESHSPSI